MHTDGLRRHIMSVEAITLSTNERPDMSNVYQCNCGADKVEGFLNGVHEGACNSRKRIYPEIVGFQSRGVKIDPPKFPAKCPACKALAVTTTATSCRYACGGKYEQKSQIQNHTDYFWGACGLK